MGRAPLSSPDSVRAAVRQLLDEAGTVAPVTPLLFRRVVSARRVRELLGGGDPARIGRQLRTIESEIMSESAARYATDGLPEPLAASMRSLWANALEAARLEFVTARTAADVSVASAERERDNATALTRMLRTEIDDWQQKASERDTQIGQARAELAALQRQLVDEQRRARAAESRLEEISRIRGDERQTYDEALAAVHLEYKGLSHQLMKATDEDRQALAAMRATFEAERRTLQQQLAKAMAENEHLKRDLAGSAAASAPVGRPSSGSDRDPAA